MKLVNKRSKYRILKDVKLGEGVQLFYFINAYGCEIGDGTKVGSFVEIQKGVKIGKRCKIQSHTFICEGVRIGKGVFLGHNVTFINDRYPRAVDTTGKTITDGWSLEETVIEDNVSIGSSVTILCGITVGRGALIGAGSVVTKDIPEGSVAVGNPARITGKRKDL